MTFWWERPVYLRKEAQVCEWNAMRKQTPRERYGFLRRAVRLHSRANRIEDLQKLDAQWAKAAVVATSNFKIFL